MVNFEQVERNQLIKYRFAALFAFPKRMLAVHIFMYLPAFNMCSSRVLVNPDEHVCAGALFVCACGKQVKTEKKEKLWQKGKMC